MPPYTRSRLDEDYDAGLVRDTVGTPSRILASLPQENFYSVLYSSGTSRSRSLSLLSFTCSLSLSGSPSYHSFLPPPALSVLGTAQVFPPLPSPKQSKFSQGWRKQNLQFCWKTTLLLCIFARNLGKTPDFSSFAPYGRSRLLLTIFACSVD